ncbi:MAG: hypothetical protein COA36_13140 [Desulfotalea sp.]|nr:MAG: hypothetical protein COA36_13140 [Desulfotalea sp.]
MKIDENHSFKCTSCHQGNDTAKTKENAHIDLIDHPAHPKEIARTCMPCHQEISAEAPQSMHFTLKNSTNLFRKAFGATADIDSFTDTPTVVTPSTPLELGDDLLRRRCFKCHLYDSGQAYPSTSHGQGCAACHVTIVNSKLADHVFHAPTDAQCLSCHYGNYVGFDYYGRFEHDFNVEYRTPYTTNNDHFRPFGVEYHQLNPDIHQKKGLSCIDCHSGNELMRQGQKTSCTGCHDVRALKVQLPPRVSQEGNSYILTTHSGKKHPIPTLLHPAHTDYNETVSCQACHAQWSFEDKGKHFLRIDTDELDSFSALPVQGNYEIEKLLTNNFDYEKDELPIEMTDSLTGKRSAGIWLKGYITRRWENVSLGRDAQGKIAVVRPTLDYTLSWIDANETVQIDAVQSQTKKEGLRPYIPHTTGNAGVFYQSRLQQFLKLEQQAKNKLSSQPVTPEQ